MKINDFIQKAFVISMRDRKDKRESFFKQFEGFKEPLEIEYFPAVDGKKLGSPPWWKWGDGHYGCYCSHVQILQDMISEGWDNVLIFEDDAVITSGFVPILESALDELPPDYDMLYIGGCCTNEPVKFSEHLLRVNEIINTHGYIVSWQGAKKLYSAIADMPDWFDDMHRAGDYRRAIEPPWQIIDRIYQRFIYEQRITCYAVHPWICGQSTASSDITGESRQRNDFWPARPVPKKPIGGIADVVFSHVSWGELGLNGSLGYGNLRVDVDLFKDTNNDIQWISAHAPSRVVIHTKTPLYVTGTLNNTSGEQTDHCVFQVNGFTVGTVNKPSQYTNPHYLEKPGEYFLDVAVNNNARCHTLFGLSVNNPEPKEETIKKYPGIEIITNAQCPRMCPGCNQQHWMEQNRDYQYTPADAKYLVNTLTGYGIDVNLMFSGGEPKYWKHLKTVMGIFKQSEHIKYTQVYSSQFDEDNVGNLVSNFDAVFLSVRNDSACYLDNTPVYMQNCNLIDQRKHRIVTGETRRIDCCCMDSGVTACVIGQSVYPCTTAAELSASRQWWCVNPISVDDYFSGIKTFPPIGSYRLCGVCPNNALVPCIYANT